MHAPICWMAVRRTARSLLTATMVHSVHNGSAPVLQKVEVGLACFEHMCTAVANVVLSALHVVLQGAECHLRLNHPELSKVPRCVRVFGTEGRAKRVDVGESAGIVLAIELPRDGEKGRFAKKVVCVVHRRPLRLCSLDATYVTEPACRSICVHHRFATAC